MGKVQEVMRHLLEEDKSDEEIVEELNKIFRRNNQKMGVKWKDKEMSSQLIAQPAAKMLTVFRINPGKWKAECLGRETVITAIEMSDAKLEALRWFQGILGDVIHEVLVLAG